MSNDSTATQARVTRRGVLTKTAAGIGTAAAVNAGMEQSDVSGPVGSADAIVCSGLCIAGAAVGVAAGGAAIGYLGGSYLEDKFLGDSRDYSGYTGADALYSELYAGAVEMESADERVMTSIQNNITHSQNVALSKGKAAIIKEMNAGNGETAATTAMQNAIDGYYSSIQQNIISHANAQISQVYHHIEQLQEHADATMDGASLRFYHSPPDLPGTVDEPLSAYDGTYSLSTHSKTLLDGSTVSVNWIHLPSSGTPGEHSLFGDQVDGSDVGEIFEIAYNGDETKYCDLRRFVSALDDVSAERDNVNGQLSGFVSDVYAQYSAGGIPTEDLVDPITAATELSQNYDGEQGQSAFAAMLGIPTSAEQSVWLTLETDGVDLVADLYTEHVPTDSDGNEIGFEAGKTYDPANFTAPVYVAYEAAASQGSTPTETATATETGTQVDQQFIHPDTAEQTASDFVEIDQPFTIQQIKTPDGSTVESFQTTSQNTQTADVSKLQEELAQIREIQTQMQEEAQEETGGGGGGGGFLADSSDRELGILALGGAALVYLLGNN